MSIRGLFALVVLVLGAFFWYEAVHRTPPAAGIVAPEYPQQGALSSGENEWPVGGGGEYRARALATYRIHARVLGAKHYAYDLCAPIAPVDLALGWGRMSDSAVYDRLGISQRGRFYVYGWGKEGPPISPNEIVVSSSNNHIIPGTPEVARALGAVRQDDVIWMEGALVEVTGPGGFRWRSSLAREDTGNGACELFRVTNLVIERPPDR